MAANRKQAMVPEGAIALDPVGTAPGLVVPAGEAVVIVLPGPPRELQPMWPVALEAAPVRAVLERATPLRGYTLRMFGVPESEIAKSLREIEGDGVEIDAVEITTCLRRGEIEIDVRYRDEAASDRRCGARGPQAAPRAPSLQPRRRDDRLPGREAAAGAAAGAGRVLQRRAAGGADNQGPRRLGLHGGQRGRLFQRGEGGAARRRSGADRRQGRGLAGGRRGDGDRGPGSLRGRRRGRDHRHRRAGRAEPRRSRSATSASTPASPTAPRSPATRSSPAAARTSANAPPWSGCTCCESCSAAPSRRFRRDFTKSSTSRLRLVAKAP